MHQLDKLLAAVAMWIPALFLAGVALSNRKNNRASDRFWWLWLPACAWMICQGLGFFSAAFDLPRHESARTALFEWCATACGAAYLIGFVIVGFQARKHGSARTQIPPKET